MELNPKKYIDFLDQIFNLDNESKSKTTWIVVSILNILMTIELAIFLAESFGYDIVLSTIGVDTIVNAFKYYHVIIGVTCFVLTYFGARIIFWILPNAVAYTKHWNTFTVDNNFKAKMNKNLDDQNEFDRWKISHDRRFNTAKLYTDKCGVSLLFTGQLFLTYYFIVHTYHSALYNDAIALLLFSSLVVVGFVYSIFKGDLLFQSFMGDYFENRTKFRTEEIKKVDRYAFKGLHWVVNFVSIAVIVIVIATAFN